MIWILGNLLIARKRSVFRGSELCPHKSISKTSAEQEVQWEVSWSVAMVNRVPAEKLPHLCTGPGLGRMTFLKLMCVLFSWGVLGTVNSDSQGLGGLRAVSN